MNHGTASARNIALGGVLAALAVSFMSIGGLIPVATYVCPMLCALVLQFVCTVCGNSIGWAWYGAVSILSLLLSPDKEAAATFLFLGYYPIVKPWLDKRKLKWVFKLLLFNASIGAMYWLLLRVFGLSELSKDFAGMSFAMAAVLVLLGNVTFVLLDRVLEKDLFKRLVKHGK